MTVGLSMVLAATPAGAHFLLNLNVRILHVEHLADGMRVYLRTPMPYLVADRVGPVGANGLPEPAPYTSNRMEDGRLVHYLEPGALHSDPQGLGRLAAEGFQLRRDGKRLDATVERVRAYPVGTQPPFATLAEARAAFETKTVFPADVARTYVGDVVVDIILRYRAGGPVYGYSVSSSLDPGLPDQENTANLILDYSPGATRVFRARGLLAEPIEVSTSPWSAIFTFIKEGVRHILEGYDHVLFIICLTLGATRLTSLVWRATGFTIGHSVALIAGFFGFVPSGLWFIPTVETGIALSIIYAAALAVTSPQSGNRGEVQMLYITTAIGLLHGFGFSFVLHELLKVDSPDIWQSLLAFNVGVEIGQLLIISIAWMVFRAIQRMNDRAWQLGRYGIAASCAMVAVVWTVQRVSMIVDTI
jgi:hypothetical protein